MNLLPDLVPYPDDAGYFLVPDTAEALTGAMQLWGELVRSPDPDSSLVAFRVMRGAKTHAEVFMHGYGFMCEGENISLRECRHTYWGENGYIYYLDKRQMLAILGWLGRYFDLD